MLNIGFGELVVILLIAFLVVGPKDLPKLARGIARGLRELRKLLGEVREVVNPKEEETYLKELSQSLSEAKATIDENNPVKIVKKELASLDPMADVKQDLSSIRREVDSLQSKTIGPKK